MLVARGCFIGEAIGAMEYYPKNAAQNYGDAVEGAKTAAFRRCAKEFGVGLQAWKKDWCQGWFDRKLGKKPAAAPTKPAEPAVIPPPSAKTREWFIAEVIKTVPAEQMNQFCIDLGWLMPNEGLKDLDLRFVANTPAKLKAFKNCLDNWMANGDTVQPYDCPIPDPKDKKPVEVPLKEAPGFGSEDQEPWFNVIVPIPRKGMKRDEYLRNPDTIGSLYDLRKDDETARKRLWGLRKGGEECGWVPKPREFNGKIYQPSDADKAFYKALKQFADWYDENHNDEKL